MTSPTQRTLKALREDGYLAAVTEHWNPHAKIRQDLFGFGDVLACRPGEILIVQATAEDVAARMTKIDGLQTENGSPGQWLAAGGQIEVWGWVKRRSKARNADGKRSVRSEIRLRKIRAELQGSRLAWIEETAEEVAESQTAP